MLKFWTKSAKMGKRSYPFTNPPFPVPQNRQIWGWAYRHTVYQNEWRENKTLRTQGHFSNYLGNSCSTLWKHLPSDLFFSHLAHCSSILMTWACTLILFAETWSCCAGQFVNQLQISVVICKYWIQSAHMAFLSPT